MIHSGEWARSGFRGVALVGGGVTGKIREMEDVWPEAMVLIFCRDGVNRQEQDVSFG